MEIVIDVLKIVVIILSGITTAIPLVVALIDKSKELVVSKQYNRIYGVVMKLMQRAEQLYSTGAERRQWVLAAVHDCEELAGLDINDDMIADMIETVVNVTKLVNSK